VIPDIEAFEERAVIAEYNGGLIRDAAEDLAARAQGFRDAIHCWSVVKHYAKTKKLPAT
jgi:hypothetical protein